LERVTDEKLTHMLSIQKSPTDKTELGYVASQPPTWIKERLSLVDMFRLLQKPLKSLVQLESLLYATTVV
jgi:hypothetical protein